MLPEGTSCHPRCKTAGPDATKTDELQKTLQHGWHQFQCAPTTSLCQGWPTMREGAHPWRAHPQHPSPRAGGHDGRHNRYRTSRRGRAPTTGHGTAPAARTADADLCS